MKTEWTAPAALAGFLWLACPPTAGAEPPAPALATRAALQSAVAALPLGTIQLDPRTDWRKVQQLSPGTEIILTTSADRALPCRVVTVSDTTLTVQDDGGPRSIRRDDVLEVRRSVRTGGSKVGAAIGAGGGFVLGLLSATHLAYKDCNGSCRDEKTLIVLSLTALPVATGYAGYRLGARRQLTTVYLRP